MAWLPFLSPFLRQMARHSLRTQESRGILVSATTRLFIYDPCYRNLPLINGIKTANIFNTISHKLQLHSTQNTISLMTLLIQVKHYQLTETYHFRPSVIKIKCIIYTVCVEEVNGWVGVTAIL